MIRALTPTDLPRVAAIHSAAFPTSALTRLGADTLVRYYDWLLTGPHQADCLGFELKGDLAGYCFSGLFRGAMSGFIRQNRAHLIGRVLLRPWLLVGFSERLRTGARIAARTAHTPPPADPIPPGRPYVVLAIAVDPAAQGNGVGGQLMAEAERRARTGEFAAMRLSVRVENTGAVRFYERLGWQRVGEQWHGRMIKRLG
ncbi:MAG: GNAT family N-acetyltransferase [Anaerolineae bacterium]